MVNKDTHFVMKNGKAEQPFIAKEGLQLYYDAKGKKNTDVNKGMLLDMSGNGRNGTLANFAYEGISGFRNGLYFDGVDDRLTVPSVPLETCSMNKNLFNGVWVQGHANGSPEYYLNRIRSEKMIKLRANQSYTLSFSDISTIRYGYYIQSSSAYPVSGVSFTGWYSDTASKTFTPTVDSYISIMISATDGVSNLTPSSMSGINVQLEENSDATAYVPYVAMPRMTYQLNNNVLSYGDGGSVKTVVDGNIVESNVNFLANSNLATISRGTVTSKHDNTYLTGWGQYNGGISNPTVSYHAHIDTDTFGFNVIEYNESDGNRNWKGTSKGGFELLTKEIGIYTISFDLFPTGSGTRIFGGFYGYLVGGTTNNFHGGQFSISPTHTNSWQRYSTTVTMHQNMDFSRGISFYIYGYGFSTNSILYVNRMKLEKGSVATPYSVSPHDLNLTTMIGNHVGDLERDLNNNVETVVHGYSPVYTSSAEEKSVALVEVDGISKQDVENSNVVKDGLVMWLSGKNFNSSGVWKDLRGLSNGSNSGFAYNTTSGSDNYGGVVFDGVNDRVTIPSIASTMLTNGAEAQPVTLEVWAKLPATQPTGQSILLGRVGFNTGILAFNGSIKASLWNSSQSNRVITKTVSANTTFHAVATFDNGVMKLYHNGVFVGENSDLAGNPYLALGGSMEIGGSASWILSGTVYAARIYNKVLSQAEVTQNYNAGLSIDMPCAGYPSVIKSLNNNFDLVSSKYNRNMATGTATPITGGGFTGIMNYCPSMYRIYSDGMTLGGKVTVSFDFEYSGFVGKAGYTPTARLQGSGNITGWTSGAWGAPNFTSMIDWVGGSGKIRVRGVLDANTNFLKNDYWNMSIRFDYVQSGTFTVSNFKVEAGDVANPVWCKSPLDIGYEDVSGDIYKTSIATVTPMRSIGAVSDKLFKDLDGLWKIQRNIGVKVFNGTEAISKNSTDVNNYLYYIRAADLGTTDANVPYIISHMKDNAGTSGNPYLFGYTSSDTYNVLYLTLGLTQGENTSTGFRNWLAQQYNAGTPFTVQYVLPAPTYETLPTDMQINLNNIQTYQFDNYVYTVGNLNPMLHASFKKTSWFKEKYILNSLKVYNRELSDAEMIKNYKIEKERFDI